MLKAGDWEEQTIQEVKKIILIAIAVGLLLLMLVLSKYPCGDIADELQRKINNVDGAYGDKVAIEIIPCEMRYLNVRLKKMPPSQIPLHSIHTMLYDKDRRSGWITLKIYDPAGRYLFSHSSENKIYIQRGN